MVKDQALKPTIVFVYEIQKNDHIFTISLIYTDF